VFDCLPLPSIVLTVIVLRTAGDALLLRPAAAVGGVE
jgi:hypothetical protein